MLGSSDEPGSATFTNPLGLQASHEGVTKSRSGQLSHCYLRKSFLTTLIADQLAGCLAIRLGNFRQLDGQLVVVLITAVVTSPLDLYTNLIRFVHFPPPKLQNGTSTLEQFTFDLPHACWLRLRLAALRKSRNISNIPRFRALPASSSLAQPYDISIVHHSRASSICL